jgi:hypothetical protein
LFDTDTVLAIGCGVPAAVKSRLTTLASNPNPVPDRVRVVIYELSDADDTSNMGMMFEAPVRYATI